MKRLFLLSYLFFPAASMAALPTQIGGIVLGSNISEYQQNIRANTTLPIRFMEYLDEVETHSVPGFKSGYIAYGNCAEAGRIVRIKLKYQDSSKDFFERLFKEYKSQLGRPSEWLGDPFHVVTNWKWSFSDDTRQVTLYLQHNSSDASQKLGTSMKITMNNLIDEEQSCFNSKFPEYRKNISPGQQQKSDGWQGLVPQ